MAFKMKGFPFQSGIGGEKASEDLKSEVSKDQKLGGRWKGMTLSQFDANVAKERKSIGDDPKTLKAFDARQANLRIQAINAAK